MAWTESRIEFARARWEAGDTAAAIARALCGVTRNAVIGKLNRLGVFRDTPVRSPGRRAANPNKIKGARLARTYESKRMEKPLPPAPIAPLNIPFLDREPYQCRAITDPTRFAQKVCGHPTHEGSVYCQWHNALHHVPRKPERAR